MPIQKSHLVAAFVFAFLLAAAPRVHAQIPVTDAGNLTQNMVTAIKTTQTVINTFEQIEHLKTQIQNQLQMLRSIDPTAFEWWQIFAHVKGLAIWISSSKEYASGNNTDPIFLIGGWFCTDRHNRILAEKFVRMTAE